MKAIAELARAQAELEPGRVVDALDRTLEVWRAPDSLWRERLKREQGVYSREVIEAGVVGGLGHWTGEALARLRARDVPEQCWAPPVTAVWLAGSIPTAAFAAILLPLLAGSCVYAKPSSADPTSGRLFAESLRAVDGGVARAVLVGDDRGALEAADAVVAYGRDETLAELRARVPVDRVFIGYGHKLSIAAVGPDVPLEAAARALGLDVALYDGRGCLSPAYVFVEDQPPGRAEALAEGLAAELERLAETLPRGPISDAERTYLHDLRAALAMRDDALAMLSPGSLAWGVILADFERTPPIPGQLRTVPVIPVRDLDALADRCSGLAPHLSSIGHAGFGDREPVLARIARRAGGSRLCPLGRMQFPPIDWHHDGRDPIRPLLRFVDRETPEKDAT